MHQFTLKALEQQFISCLGLLHIPARASIDPVIGSDTRDERRVDCFTSGVKTKTKSKGESRLPARFL